MSFIPYPPLYFNSALLVTNASNPRDVGLRSYLSGWTPSTFALNTKINVNFKVVISGSSVDSTGIAFRADHLRLYVPSISSSWNENLSAIFKVGDRYVYDELYRSGSGLYVRDRGGRIRTAIQHHGGSVDMAIVDEGKLSEFDTIRPKFFFKINGTAISNTRFLNDVSISKGYHSIDPVDRVADIGECRVRLISTGGVWNNEESITIYGATIDTRNSIMEYGITFDGSDTVLFKGRVDEIKKSESAGEEQDVIEVIARDVILDISELRFPLRCNEDDWYYSIPITYSSRDIDEGDVVIPAGETASTDHDRVPSSSSLRHVVRNVIENIGDTVTSDFADWTESERRLFAGVDGEHEGRVVPYLKSLMNSEYGFMWSDRQNRIRTRGRRFWSFDDAHKRLNTHVIHDGMVDQYYITGIGDLNYSRLKIQSSVYGEISRFIPSDTGKRGTHPFDDANVFYRLVNIDNDENPEHFIGANSKVTFEIKLEAISRDDYLNNTAISGVENTVWRDYSDGQSFVGAIPMRVATGDTEIDLELTEYNQSGVLSDTPLAPTANANGVRKDRLKEWSNGAICALMSYNNQTLVVEVDNKTTNRLAITRLVFVGRMIKSLRVDDISKEYDLESNADNEIVYPARYANFSRNSCGGVGNEGEEIAELIDGQFNNKRRWVESISMSATRSKHAMKTCLSSGIGEVVMVRSDINQISHVGVVMSEDWDISWPRVSKRIHLSPINKSLERFIEPLLALPSSSGSGLHGGIYAPVGAAMYDHDNDAMHCLWSKPRVPHGFTIDDYTLQRRTTSSGSFSTIATVNALERKDAIAMQSAPPVSFFADTTAMGTTPGLIAKKRISNGDRWNRRRITLVDSTGGSAYRLTTAVQAKYISNNRVAYLVLADYQANSNHTSGTVRVSLESSSASDTGVHDTGPNFKNVRNYGMVFKGGTSIIKWKFDYLIDTVDSDTTEPYHWNGHEIALTETELDPFRDQVDMVIVDHTDPNVDWDNNRFLSDGVSDPPTERDVASAYAYRVRANVNNRYGAWSNIFPHPEANNVAPEVVVDWRSIPGITINGSGELVVREDRTIRIPPDSYSDSRYRVDRWFRDIDGDSLTITLSLSGNHSGRIHSSTAIHGGWQIRLRGDEDNENMAVAYMNITASDGDLSTTISIPVRVIE